MTQKILDEFRIRQKTHVINTDNGSNMRKAMRDLSKIEIQSTQLDVTRSTTDGEGAGVAQEVQDEFLPDLVLDDPLLEDDDDEDRERDAFITSMEDEICLLHTSPSPRDGLLSRMPSSA